MNGRKLVTGFLVFLGIFVAALIWFQFFAYYRSDDGLDAITIAGAEVPVTGYAGIEGTSSPLKRRGCFTIDPAAVEGLAADPDATPLVAPFWFRCYDARTLSEDLASGAAKAYDISPDTPEGFDLMLAVYPDGRGYLWRQLNARYAE